LKETLEGAELVLFVVPSHATRDVALEAKPLIPEGALICNATKGIENDTLMLMSEVMEDVLGEASRPRLTYLSGPSFAREVADGLPTAVTVAASSPEHARRVADYLHGERFRAYTSDDIIGVQVAGAAKNVLAIATGIADGLGFGANTRAALITRGLAELIRLGTALGGHQETFVGLAGLGDLVLTCTDDQSRNRRMGLALARGLSVESAKVEIGQEVEGVITARSVYATVRRLGVEMPISEQVHGVLYLGTTPAEATENLLTRRSKAEFY
jgi:glycerol-3-phosphate dehydrogenase (NAD(P)+)